MTKQKLIYQAAKAGLSWQAIGTAFGISKEAVFDYAVKHGVWNKRENEKIKALEKLKVGIKKLTRNKDI